MHYVNEVPPKFRSTSMCMCGGGGGCGGISSANIYRHCHARCLRILNNNLILFIKGSTKLEFSHVDNVLAFFPKERKLVILLWSLFF